MPNFYAEILRSIGARDHNFKLLASNDPSTSTIAWAKDIGVTATSDGDILSFSGTTSGLGVTYFPSPANLSTTTFPYLVFRAKQANPGTLAIAVHNSGADIPFSVNLTPNWKTYTVGPMTSGRTISSILFGNQSVAGTINFHNAAVCAKTPIQLSQTDLEMGAVTRMAFGFDSAYLRLNNQAGKFVTGANSVGFGDHLHIYLPRYGDATGTLYHSYGGYCEVVEPFQPNIEVNILGRGYGLGPGRTIHLNSYQNKTPQFILNDIVDNSINAASKNGIPIKSNYQLTRSYVQAVGASLPIYLTQLKTTFDTFREIADLTTAQLTPAAFWVDPAENLHWVPLGAQGTANWTTDPYPANYPVALAVGKNQITNQFRRDTQSVRNRIHYIGVAQSPGLTDLWTENNSSAWGSERVASGTTFAFNDIQSPAFGGPGPVALGQWSVNAHISGTGEATGAFFYPAVKGLGLDLSNLGSIYSPPIFEFYWRIHTSGASLSGPVSGTPDTIFFAEDASNRFEYSYVGDLGVSPHVSILNINGNNNITRDFWYHVLVPIGPNGGTLFLNPPTLNGIASASYTGTSGYQLANVGNPHWNNINYFGWYYRGQATPAETIDIYVDGVRIVGGRYRIPYDNRASAYPDMAEAMVWDPISKDEALIKKLAAAELFRLRNPIMRGDLLAPILGDVSPEQQVQITAPAANLNSTYLRIYQIKHTFSPHSFVTELSLSDDFINSQPLERWRFYNAVMQMGENAILSREVYDLKTALIDPGFTPVLDPYS
jgi:hypothetical protein